MNELQRPPFSPRVLAGFVLVALGILFTLDSFHIVDAGSIGDYWPLVLDRAGHHQLRLAAQERRPILGSRS